MYIYTVYLCLYIYRWIYIFSSSIENCRSCFQMIRVHFQLFKHALLSADEFPFPASPCVKSELSSLPGSLRSKSARTFLRFGPPSFFLFFFFLKFSQPERACKRASEGLAKQVRGRILKGPLNPNPHPPPQVPAQTQPQMYIYVCRLGI